jgi:hypothetical protein
VDLNESPPAEVHPDPVRGPAPCPHPPASRPAPPECDSPDRRTGVRGRDVRLRSRPGNGSAGICGAVADLECGRNQRVDQPFPRGGRETPSPAREEQRYLTADQVALLAKAIHPRYRALVLLGAYGALRWGELAGLRAARLRLLQRRIDVLETLIEVQGRIVAGPPKTGPEPSASPFPWPRSCRTTWLLMPKGRTGCCSPRQRVDPLGSAPFSNASGGPQWSGLVWHRFGSTTSVTPLSRWRWRPAPTRRRSRNCVGMPPSRPPSTCTGTCSRPPATTRRAPGRDVPRRSCPLFAPRSGRERRLATSPSSKKGL